MNRLSILKSVLSVVFLFMVFSLSAQELEVFFKDKGERYFRFTLSSESELSKISDMVSIDHIDGKEIIANASLDEFKKFLELNIPYEFLPHPSDLIDFDAVELSNIKDVRQWDFYPTYDAYVALMNGFAADHPDLCQIHNIGTLPSGRQLLAARITSNVIGTSAKPKFLYTSSMHGDELTGYILTMRLIDHLLINYGTDPRITRLVDSIDIWINPLANPDGTYYGGNHTVNGARRRNANNVDLNRNYPDPAAGPHPDGYPWQPETVHFMNLAEIQKFNMSCNLHGGAEVCNYPWDTWAHLTADNNWWVYTMREFADTIIVNSPSPYFRGFDNGIVRGYDWYSITGGRQDYMNYFQQCREFCLEISNTKMPSPTQMPTFWNYNYRSFLNYMEQSLYGIRGVITNSVTGEPVHAMINIQGHDIDSSFVFSNAQDGGFHRYIYTGTYNLTIEAPCFKTKVINGVSIANRHTTWVNVALEPAMADFSASANIISPGNYVTFTSQQCVPIDSWQWIFDGGFPSTSTSPNPIVQYPVAGIYDVKLIATANGISDTITKSQYITAITSYTISNSTVTTCFAMFYDTGGPNGNYGSNENLTMTFLPSQAGSNIQANFVSFATEANYDFLYIYNGTNTSAPQFPGSPFHGGNSPGFIEASNSSGAITFRFTSDYSVTKSGWEAQITCSGTPILPGDANCDGSVNTLDVIITTSYIMGQNPQPFCFENADINGDGIINISDVIGVVYLILGTQ